MNKTLQNRSCIKETLTNYKKAYQPMKRKQVIVPSKMTGVTSPTVT